MLLFRVIILEELARLTCCEGGSPFRRLWQPASPSGSRSGGLKRPGIRLWNSEGICSLHGSITRPHLHNKCLLSDSSQLQHLQESEISSGPCICWSKLTLMNAAMWCLHVMYKRGQGSQVTFSAGSDVGVLRDESWLTDLRKLSDGRPLPCFTGFLFCTEAES